MVYSTYLWWFGRWFIFILPTLIYSKSKEFFLANATYNLHKYHCIIVSCMSWGSHEMVFWPTCGWFILHVSPCNSFLLFKSDHTANPTGANPQGCWFSLILGRKKGHYVMLCCPISLMVRWIHVDTQDKKHPHWSMNDNGCHWLYTPIPMICQA